ncbi:hypothetical protein WMY93_027354 [Mugilogobius chulae]|uniref:Leucine-rich repeat and transmembrane domain-containing protein 1 n=1 Tax=Mugilogobius chulae TaxID=88201 RepID=A0AAW0MW47_9GOBI
MRVAVLWALVPLLLTPSDACPKECTCNSNTKVVDCRGRGLYDIPRRLHPDTQELYLQDNRIRGLGSMAFRDIPLVRILDLAITFTPGPITQQFGQLARAIGESLRNVSHLGLAYNRFSRLERSLLDNLEHINNMTLRGNPWRCDCQLIGLKLWLETYLFKGGTVDDILCTQPDEMKDKDLQKIPYQLFHTCMTTSYHYLFANIHHLESDRVLRSHAHGNHVYPPGHTHHATTGDGGGGGGGGGGGSVPECEAKQKHRPVNLRHAIATVIITGVVCGIVCLMMLAAAVYGCAYAAIMAKYQRELKKNEELAAAQGADHATADEKEPLENAIA